MNKFKVGDRVKMLFSCNGTKEGEIYTLTKTDEGLITDMGKDTKPFLCGCQCIGNWELIMEDKMSKYTELKQRIEAINQNTTVKEWDDLLNEINNGRSFMFRMDNYHSDASGAKIEVYANPIGHQAFEWKTQCEKGEAIKKAMLWLLDHSDIKKDEKVEKIAELKKQMNQLSDKHNQDIEEIRQKIKELK